ncbi:MAG: glutamate-1-semialdehyde 2,1-aminomutase [Dehalococcoidia bacterium]|nr:glutamate-1-semialdehyde 2,1-aminomutase [Dehalococcoidia bacterium]
MNKSSQLYEEAKRLLPGGVSSPVRAFKAVGGEPFFVEKARGSRLYDVDGRAYIDYVCGWGPLILGHAHPQVVAALQEAVARGTCFGTPIEQEVVLARMVTEAFPSIQKVRFVTSGTEATMSALRLARAFTRREKIIKFEGCYHGHSDMLLVAAGSGALTLGIPDSPGVPVGAASTTLVAQYNDLQTVADLFDANYGQIATVILEPVAGNMGVVLPEPGFLPGLRDLCSQHGALLIFDEVITGFRVSYGGAQAVYGVTPDLTCLGKIIGGGLSVGAYGGPAEIMARMAPEGPVYQAGTLSGNPLAMTAGIETLKLLREPGFYDSLDRKAQFLCNGIANAAAEAGVPISQNRIGSMFTTFFTDQPISSYATVKTSNTRLYSSYFHAMLEEGVYFAPSQFEASFVSLAHSQEDLEITVETARKAFQGIR